MTITANSPFSAEKIGAEERHDCSSNATAAAPLKAIAMILAQGVLRLQKRQKQLDSPADQSVHSHVLVTKGEAL